MAVAVAAADPAKDEREVYVPYRNEEGVSTEERLERTHS